MENMKHPYGKTTRLKAVLPIKPQYADMIVSGEKTVEYRKVYMRRLPEAIVIWATRPVGRIIGEVAVAGCILGTPAEVWERTKERGGIGEEAYEEYFDGKRTAYAYELGGFRTFDRELTLGRLGLARPPQSFAYVWHITDAYGPEDWVPCCRR